MTYKATSITEVFRSETLTFLYEFQDENGVGRDVSGWTIEYDLFVSQNSPVDEGDLVGGEVSFTSDGTDGQLDVTVSTNFDPGTYEFQLLGIDANGKEEVLVTERIKINFNSHRRG